MFDKDILLLQPIEDHLNTAHIVYMLDIIPGAFRDMHEKNMWILVVPAAERDQTLARREKDPTYYSSNTRISLLPDATVEVVPGGTTLDWGRAQKFVTWLLTLEPWQITVGGKVLGHITAPSDIYTQAWPDPNESANPTESPPKMGHLLTLTREVEGERRKISVHDSGFISYMSTQGDLELTRVGRLTSELRARWPELINGLPMDSDHSGPNGEYTDPIYLMMETPTDLAEVKLDAAHLDPALREIVTILDDWLETLTIDEHATPSGLVDISSMDKKEIKKTHNKKSDSYLI